MPHGNGPTVGVETFIIASQPQLFATAQYLGGERLVDLDYIHLRQGDTGPGQCLAAGLHRAQAHDPWGHTSHRTRQNTGARGNARRVTSSTGTDNQCRRTVIHAGGIPCGDDATLNDSRQFCQLFSGGAGAGMLILCHRQRLFLAALGNSHRQNLFPVETLFLGRLVALLGTSGKRIRCLTADAQVVGHVLGSFRHGVATELAEDGRVGEAGTDGAVENGHIAAEGFFGLGHYERRPAHGLGAAGDNQLALGHRHHTRRIQRRRQATATQAVNGNPGHGFRQPRQQAGVTRHVAGIFTGLIGIADHHVFIAGQLEPVALYQLTDHPGQQVIRTHRRQGATMATKRGSQAIVDIGIQHLHSPGSSKLQAATRTGMAINEKRPRRVSLCLIMQRHGDTEDEARRKHFQPARSFTVLQLVA